MPRLFQCRGKGIEQVACPLEEGGIVLYEDDGMPRLVQDRQELVRSERPTDFEVRCIPADVGDEPGVITADEEEEEPAESGFPLSAARMTASGAMTAVNVDGCRVMPLRSSISMAPITGKAGQISSRPEGGESIAP